MLKRTCKNLENASFYQQKQGHPNPEMTTFNINISLSPKQSSNLLVSIHSPEQRLPVTLMRTNYVCTANKCHLPETPQPGRGRAAQLSAGCANTLTASSCTTQTQIPAGIRQQEHCTARMTEPRMDAFLLTCLI